MMTKLGNISVALVTAGVAMLFATFAQAQTFTFESTSEVTSQIAVTLPNGVVVAAISVSGSSTGTDSSGDDASNTFVCSLLSEPPSERFPRLPA